MTRSPDFPNKKYSIIYADPPWNFKNWSKKGEEKNAKRHYVCMTIDDIKKLAVSTISAKDCVLFLWVTYPLLQDGLTAIKEWGFKYKTCAFSWIKRNKKKFEVKCPVAWCRNRITCFNFHSGHCKPESKGGLTNSRNLIPICAKCNLSMSNNYTIKQFSKKFA